MVKTPKTRHSKDHREPVTIELQPGEVSRVVDKPAEANEAAAGGVEPEAPAQDAMRAQAADFEPWEENEAASAAAAEQAERAQADSRTGFGDAPWQTEPAASDHAGTKNGFAASETARPGRGVNGILAGIAGGVIALIGAGALQYAGLLGAPGASLDGVNGEISAMKTQIAAISNSESGGDAAARVKMLSDGLDQVKTELASLKTAVEAEAGDAQGVAELRDKVAAMDTAVAALGQAGAAAPVDLDPLQEKLAAVEAVAKGAGDTVTQQQSRLGALEQSVSQLSGKIDAQSSQPKVALSLAAAALKAALDRGTPFSAELETFAAMTPDAPQVAALRPYAETGVASRADIAAGIDAAANAMVAADAPPDEDAGFFENLMSSAETLVTVRPVGAVDGPGVPETVARIEAAARQGAYAKALSEYATLPDTAKAAGADFAARLKARVDAETQVDALIASAMKA